MRQPSALASMLWRLTSSRLDGMSALTARPAVAALQQCSVVRGFATKAPLGGNKGSGAKKGGKDAQGKDAPKKKKKKVGKAKEAGGGGSRGGDLGGLEQLLETQLSQPPVADPRTPAEKALDHEYAKEYSRRMMAEHKAQLKVEHAFLRTRWTAINALPTSLRTEALKEDMTPWPKHFQPIPWTPEEYVKRFGNSGAAAANNSGDKK